MRLSLDTASSMAAMSLSRSVSSSRSTSISFGVYVTPILTSTSFLLGGFRLPGQRRGLGRGRDRLGHGLGRDRRRFVPSSPPRRAAQEAKGAQAQGHDQDRGPLAAGEPEVADVLTQEVLHDPHGAVPDREDEDQEAAVTPLLAQVQEQGEQEDG